METVRDLIASDPEIPAPPPGATHALAWDPYGPSRSEWALGALDGPPEDEIALWEGPADIASEDLAVHVSGLLGFPVVLSPRFEVQDEAGYYVTPAGGGS